jgi:signal transduction histidine kinase
VALMLRGLAAHIHQEHADASTGIDEIVTLVNHAIQVTRTLAHGLSPVATERGGLLASLRTLATRSSEAFGIAVTLRTRLSVEPRLDESAANHLHRIVQEALSNALRHGQARSVKIHLASDVQSIRLSIRDDGRGITLSDADRSGLGLRTMDYRAQVIGGQLEIAVHPQGGTVVRCVCPQGARTRPRA